MADERISRAQTRASSPTRPDPVHAPEKRSSPFERIITACPPISESLLLQLPTSSIISLYHTSECLRQFLQDYPTAWKSLSFRSPSPSRSVIRQGSPGSDASADSSASSSKLYNLDLLLVNIVLPFGVRLRTLELDHTTIAGESLAHCVLHARRDTLEHLSVRGCKQISLKYHIVPFLTLFKLQQHSRPGSIPKTGLKLKSLYTFRCRHHRRRPYTPESLLRKDSDSLPTHDLIQLCHELGIWTDSAWCPTVGGRCLRRKEYSFGRGTPDAKIEVWVVYDRLWRSCNRLGPRYPAQVGRRSVPNGHLWQDAETGYNGEPLGCQEDGKGVPAHLRRSHATFTEDIKCDGCSVQVQERCEHCSIMMHCMGCRKTFCQTCAFSRPLPRGTNHDRENGNHLWWAPGTSRNPNLMLQEITPDANSTIGFIPNSTIPPATKMRWCCVKPTFSHGGSISFPGRTVSCFSNNQIRAVPLPRNKQYEDRDFAIRQKNEMRGTICMVRRSPGRELHHTLRKPLNSPDDFCSRNLCEDCWNVPTWKASCLICRQTLCLAHDFRLQKVRLCGYKPLDTEENLDIENSKMVDVLMEWKRKLAIDNILWEEGLKLFQEHLRSLDLSSDLSTILEAIVPLIKVPLAKDLEMKKEIHHLISLAGFGMPRRIVAPQPENPVSPTEPTEKLPSLPYDPIIRKWQGCGALMCPSHRSIFDHRPKCTAVPRECTNCTTYICPICIVRNPACDCSFCKDRYRCPNCFFLEEHKCKKTEEMAEKKRIEEASRREEAEWTRILGEANNIAERLGEFLRCWEEASISET